MPEKHGGARKGAGRRRRKLHIELDTQTARELFILVSDKKGLQPDMTEESFVAMLIHNAWHDLDQHYQECARLAN